MYGDPHIFIKNPDEPAVCFDIHGKHNYKNTMVLCNICVKVCIWRS